MQAWCACALRPRLHTQQNVHGADVLLLHGDGNVEIVLHGHACMQLQLRLTNLYAYVGQYAYVGPAGTETRVAAIEAERRRVKLGVKLG